MFKTYRTGAAGALLDEYEKIINEFLGAINDISNDELVTIVDKQTADLNCQSVQSILAHVVRAVYAYAIYIRNIRGAEMDKPAIKFQLSVNDYQSDLKNAFAFTVETFENINDNELEEPDNSKKIMTSWGQSYDIEQIMEHAIVHILRHKRQIEKFKLELRKKE
ncbi:MAG: DinB family protein [Ferruginibacter sp.]